MPKFDKKVVEPKNSVKDLKPIEAKSPPVFRLFECVVHLEIALAELKKVGIFPGNSEVSERMMRGHTELVARLDDMYKDYLRFWGEMPKP